MGENDKEIIKILKKILQIWTFNTLTFSIINRINGLSYTVLKHFYSGEITIRKLIHLLRLFSSLLLSATQATSFFLVIKGIVIRVT